MPAEGNPHGIVRVTWLLHLASFRLEYDSGKYENSFHWDFRILGIPFRLKQRAAVPKKKTETAEEEAETAVKEKTEGKEKPEDVYKRQIAFWLFVGPFLQDGGVISWIIYRAFSFF